MMKAGGMVMGGYSIFEGTIADMSWSEVEEVAKKGAVMLVPIGVIEQHGSHLPLATDTYGAYIVCILTKAELEKRGIDSVIAPPYYFGMNAATEMFPGTIHVRRESMVAVLTDAFVSYMKSGFREQFIISHHGDPQHNDAIFQAILNAREQGVDAVYVLAGLGIDVIEAGYTGAFKKPLPLPRSAIIRAEESEETRQARIMLTKSKMHVHAEERETSMIMRWFSNLIKQREKIKTFKPVTPSFREFAQAAIQGRWRELSPLGYIGDPSVATEENGQLYEYEAHDGAEAIAKFLKQKQTK